eukprot:CAMPEP_0184376258 /NCGR_PEP_ID=MMETSP0007-20130409/1302_1 /TAXON_ID=97485 /ORGANISM="Prymnesium parvum, Strain Texoma1" /LENGTH=53 /DNA_ID=CAMNT_0026719729 /DNA_START=90 /DNA_END=248 /DNA_ORIENTATION=+
MRGVRNLCTNPPGRQRAQAAGHGANKSVHGVQLALSRWFMYHPPCTTSSARRA